jgi:hypothetical protein
VTLILLPLGIPLFAVALRMYAYGVKLMLPHDVIPSPEDVGKKAKKTLKKGRKKGRKLSDSLTKALWRDALR